MKKACMFFAPGFEEVEALTVVDLLRRAGVEVTMVGAGGETMVEGSHKIAVRMDRAFSEVDYGEVELLILPGGQPGTNNLKAAKAVTDLVLDFDKKGKMLAAICAAPTVFGGLGILKGRKATCYPGCEDGLTGAEVLTDRVVVDGHITTSRGVGTAISFALSLIGQLLGEEKAKKISESIVYGHQR